VFEGEGVGVGIIRRPLVCGDIATVVGAKIVIRTETLRCTTRNAAWTSKNCEDFAAVGDSGGAAPAAWRLGFQSPL
jgi:hypothetical protein